MDIPFIMILPTATISTKFIREIFEGEIQLILPPHRLYFRREGNSENDPSSSSFESAFFCYKMNLPQDINYITDDKEETHKLVRELFDCVH